MELDPRDSYGRKVVVGFLLVVLVGGGVGGVLVTEIQSEIRGDKLATLTAESDLQEDTVSTLLENLRERTLSLSGTVASVRQQATDETAAEATLRAEFERRVGRSNATRAVVLADGDTGEILVSSESDLEGVSAAIVGYDIPENLTTGETVLQVSIDGGAESWIVYTKTRNGDVLFHVTPLSFAETKLEGVLDASRTRIVDDRGRIVYDSADKELVGTQHVAGEGVDSPAVAAGLAQADASGTRTVDGDRSPLNGTTVTGYDAVTGVDWTVVSYTQPGALFSTVQLVWQDLLILLAVVGVLLAGYGLVVERPTARRMTELRGVVERLRDGELDESIERTRRDELGDLAAGLDTMRQDLAAEIDRAREARDEAETARREAEELSDRLTRTADDYAASLSRLADGDLTVRVDADRDHEGMATVGETLNETVAQLETTVAAVQAFADDVADSMETLSGRADRIETAADGVDESVRDIAADADNQRDRLREVAAETEDLSATVEEVAATMGQVADSADRAGDLRREGREAAEDAADALDEIQAETDAAVDAVEDLLDQIGEIGAFADVIADVADQTDMLALNANVEAARTDGSGDGFAVVADEIKSLAEEAGDRADDIERLIVDVETQSQTTADRMRAASDRLADSSATVERAIETFYDIDEVVADVNDGIQDVTRATEDQAASAEAVGTAVDGVAEIAERTAAEANAAADATDDQTTATREVAATAESLAADAADLSAVADQFDTDADATDADATDVDETDADATDVDVADADTTGPDGGDLDATALDTPDSPSPNGSDD